MMDELAASLVAVRDRLSERFGDRIVWQPAFRGQLIGLLEPADLLEIVGFCRDDEQLGFRQLSDVTAVDRLPASPRFEVVYQLFALATGARLRLKVRVDEARPVPSLTRLWSGANIMEREVFDLFGIPFTGHPKLERLLTPEGFEGHPLRRDYTLGSIPVDFDIPHRKRFSDAAN